MRLTVLGANYIGLVVGTGLAEKGHFVTCVDRDETCIRALANGELPLYEPGLEELVVRNAEEERLAFSTDLAQAVADSLMVFLCLETPVAEDGAPDLTGLWGTVEEIGRAITGYRIIVNTCICPVGTAEKIRDTIAGLTPHEFDVVVNPEFIKKGNAIDDFMRPDRVVVGCEDIRVEEIMKELYAPFLRTGKPLLSMDLRSAEMVRLAVNAMLASRISMMNELAQLCEAYGAEINAVRESMAFDSRIGSGYLFPGIGFGGSALPRCLAAMARLGKEKGIDCTLIEAAATVNERHERAFIRRVLEYYGNEIAEKRIAVWGASYKSRTDDVRGAPALNVIDALLDAGAAVAVYDPVALKKLHAIYGDRVTFASKNYDAAERADGLVIVAEWNEFHRPNFERLASLMREKVIFDGRNLYSPKLLAENGFRYFSVGRASV
ncbi:MAG TPA: UDP-glucose/GDP-mannose dehydrogenase family protein [Candidatus Hydrogenedentes bacterium]|nr:UDP-glucose/GDP-mannose dehydrogenase family protein [Candidatus Hydrogenedentota bacterium]